MSEWVTVLIIQNKLLFFFIISKCVVSWLFYVQRQKKMNAYSGEQVKRYLKYIVMRVSRNYHARV
jgi:hypothetical protein